MAVMALERVPADIGPTEGRGMSDPEKIVEIQESVTIPVMAKARIGHFVEAQILEALEVDYIDESEVLTPADEMHHRQGRLRRAFVCGATNLGRRCGASARGCHDPVQGRGRNGQRGRGREAHARDSGRHPPPGSARAGGDDD